MKTSRILTVVLGLGVVSLGTLMAATNPSDAAFEEFALEQVRTQGCKELPEIIRKSCPQFVQDNRSQIKKLIMNNTERQNFLFFSIYRTNLSVRSMVPELPFFLDLPAFQLDTVGMFGKFYIYQTEKQ